MAHLDMFNAGLKLPMTDSLIKPDIIENTNNVETSSGSNYFIKYITSLESFKTKCKNLHWAAPKKNIHIYLDDFLVIISDFQDTVAEGYMGVLGKMGPTDIVPTSCHCLNAKDFIEEVLQCTINFYENIPSMTCYVGIKSETETFIQNINKYRYLFSLCDIN